MTIVNKFSVLYNNDALEESSVKRRLLVENSILRELLVRNLIMENTTSELKYGKVEKVFSDGRITITSWRDPALMDGTIAYEEILDNYINKLVEEKSLKAYLQRDTI